MTRLRAGRSGVWIPVGTRNICCLQNARIDLGVHSTLYWIRNGVVFRNLKLTAYHSLSLTLRKSGAIPPHSMCTLMACTGTPVRVPCTQRGRVLMDLQLAPTFWPRKEPLPAADIRSSVMQLVDSSWNVMTHGDAREGTWRGKMVNGVGSQYLLHYLGTWCIQHYYRWWAHLGCR